MSEFKEGINKCFGCGCAIAPPTEYCGACTYQGVPAKHTKELRQQLSAAKAEIERLKWLNGTVNANRADAINHSDLMVDEFIRIRALDFNSEVNALCERAITKTVQRIPLIEQRDQLEKERDSLRAKLAESQEECKDRQKTEQDFLKFNADLEAKLAEAEKFFNEHGVYIRHMLYSEHGSEIAQKLDTLRKQIGGE